MIIQIKPLDSRYPTTEYFKIFLAGSIEMGKADDWQNSVVESLTRRITTKNLCIFNPRRNDWDSSWKASIENKEFVYQVEWELERILKSDLVVFYFQPGTISPISLLELGIVSGKNKNCIVYCPDNFHRKGNIDVTTRWFQIETAESFEDFINKIESNILKH